MTESIENKAFDEIADEDIVVLDCVCKGSGDLELVVGALEVDAPREKIRHPLRELPQVQSRREDRYLRLTKMCDGLPPLTTAVVHPCSDDSLKDGAIEAAERNLIAPILIGPEKKIRAIAAAACLVIYKAGSCRNADLTGV